MAPKKKDASAKRGQGATKRATSERKAPPRKLSRFRRGNRPKKIRRGKYTLKLKGWLKTPADWDRFDAWAEVNALPKTYPEPEPIDRPSMPLNDLKKRLKVLAQHRTAPDPGLHCRTPTISKAALKAVPSKRTLILSLPNVRLVDYGVLFYKVSPAAMNYEPSERLLELSKPRTPYLPEECKPPMFSKCAQKHFDMGRLEQLSLAKKLAACPDALTPEELAKIFTPSGVKRSALKYKITDWMEYLALPSYKRIKPIKGDPYADWKKKIIEEGEERGKIAWTEYEEKRGTKRKRDDMEDGGGDMKDDEDEEVDEKKAKRAKRRKIAKNAWRYAPDPLKKNPYSVRKGALTGNVPPRTEMLAAPRERKEKTLKAKPYAVRKGALAASASPRIETLAQPKKPLSPVERKPRRKRNKYGEPIFEKPVYGKRLPKTKPYKMGECPPAEKKKEVKKRPIDPIAYQPTIDPCIDPEQALKQQRERKRAEKLGPKGKKGWQKRKKKKQAKKDDIGDGEQAGGEAGEPAEEAAEEAAEEG